MGADSDGRPGPLSWQSAALACALVFFGADATQALAGDGTLAHVSALAKLAFVVLLAASVWTGGDAAWSRDDSHRLSRAFVLVVLGDVLFFLRLRAPGVVAFGGAQLLLAWRNGQGLPSFVRQGRWRLRRGQVLAATCGSFAAVAVAAAVFAAGTGLHLSPGLTALGAAYALPLGGSLLVACLTPAVGYLPRVRAWQTVGAMALFFCCDVTVGLGQQLAGTTAQAVRGLTWAFYAPALWLLAASGRRPGARDPVTPAASAEVPGGPRGRE